jgi:hypothetical protein
MAPRPPRRALMLEALTLDVPDAHVARTFYVEGLGGVEQQTDSSERVHQLRINAGASQFHLALTSTFEDSATPVEAPAVWPGHVELWTREHLLEVHARLERQRITLAPVMEAFMPHLPPQPEATLIVDDDVADDTVPDRLLAVCPYGNRFVVRNAPPEFKVVGAQPAGFAGLVACPRVVYPVRRGAASRICQFFHDALGVAASLERAPAASSSEAGDGGTAGEGSANASVCVVSFSSGQQLVFDELEPERLAASFGDGARASATEAAEGSMVGATEAAGRTRCQMTFYVASLEGYRTAFRGAEKAGVVVRDPRYEGAMPETGMQNSLGWAEAASIGQFRLRLPINPRGESDHEEREGEGGISICGIAMTIRSPSHRSFPFPDMKTKGVIIEPPGFEETLTPLPHPTHPAKPGYVRVPYGRGYFGKAAQELAAAKRAAAQHVDQSSGKK